MNVWKNGMREDAEKQLWALRANKPSLIMESDGWPTIKWPLPFYTEKFSFPTTNNLFLKLNSVKNTHIFHTLVDCVVCGCKRVAF